MTAMRWALLTWRGLYWGKGMDSAEGRHCLEAELHFRGMTLTVHVSNEISHNWILLKNNRRQQAKGGCLR